MVLIQCGCLIVKIKKSQWLLQRRNNFGKETALAKYQRRKSKWELEQAPNSHQAQNLILYLKIVFRMQGSRCELPFAGDTPDMFQLVTSLKSLRAQRARVAKISRVPLFLHHSRRLIPCTARPSRTAAAGPWRPGWARWLGAAASRSRRPRPAWRVACAWGRPGRSWRSGRCLPGSAPAPGRRSVSQSLWWEITMLHFIIGRGRR